MCVEIKLESFQEYTLYVSPCVCRRIGGGSQMMTGGMKNFMHNEHEPNIVMAA